MSAEKHGIPGFEVGVRGDAHLITAVSFPNV
jgi:hypothetical protein